VANNYKYQININDAISQFTNELKKQGFLIENEIIANGKLQRCRVLNDKNNEKSGAYILYPDGYPAGFIQNFKTGYNSKWKYIFNKNLCQNSKKEKFRFDLNFKPKQSFQELTKIKEEKLKDREKNLIKEYQKTAKKLFQEFKNSHFAETNHCYLVKKQVKPYDLRQDTYGNLLIPLCDENGKFWSVQRITQNGDKFIGVIRSKTEKEQGIEYPARKKGCFYTQTPLQNHKEFNICEGFATAMTIQELIEKPTIMAVDAWNLKNVVEMLSLKFPDKKINIYADNDLKKERKGLENTGIKVANELKLKFRNINIIKPNFSQDDVNIGLSDFNDLKCKYGSNFTMHQIKLQLSNTEISY